MIATVMLSGCGSTAFLEQKDKANQNGDEINRTLSAPNDLYIESPPVDLTPLKVDKPQTWADKVFVNMNTKQVRLDDLLKDIGRRTKSTIYYGKEADKLLPVKVSVNGSLSDVAKSIESQTNYKVDLSKEGSINVLAWQTETFPLFNLVGNHDFMIGKQAAAELDAGEDSDADSSSGALFNADQDQYANITASKSSEIDDTVSVIQKIIGDEENGSVSANTSSGSITVTTRPRTMRSIEDYVSKMNSMYGKMVKVQVKILTFQKTKNSSFGIDWNLVRSTTSGSLNFASTSSGGVVNALDGIGSFSYAATGGKFDGTMLFINALREQGNVAIVTEPSMIAVNNRVGEIESLHKEGYVKSVSVDTSSSDDDDSNEYANVEQGVVSEGFSMRALVKIIDEDVLMQLSATVSKLGTFGEVDTPTVQIKTPNMTEERFNQPLRVRNGRTIVLSGYTQSTTQSGEKESFNNPLIGGNSGQDTQSQTLVLLTPIIMN
nr:hypothetical protein [Vibrio sp. S11_S32]